MRIKLVIAGMVAVVLLTATFFAAFYFLEKDAIIASTDVSSDDCMSEESSSDIEISSEETTSITTTTSKIEISQKPSFVVSAVSSKKTPSSSAKPKPVSQKPSSKPVSSQKPKEEYGYLSHKEDDYINVGETYIAEVIADSIETFNGSTTDYKSNPNNCYLPKGTVDYCSPTVLKTKDGTYRSLRYGKRVLEKYNDKPLINVTQGKLPENNRVQLIGGTQTKRYTSLIFSTEWKAPFKFKYAPQSCYKTSYGSYSVDAFTATYIEITFCYAIESGGEIKFPEDNPVFSAAQWFPGQDKTVLRLILRETGSFYGWTATYNPAGNLIFEFLNPPADPEHPISEVDLISGEALPETEQDGRAQLSGITIVIDSGHGGKDPGASNYLGTAKESVIALNLAKKLKNQLTELGANVIMTRETDQTLDPLERTGKVVSAKADLVVSLHYDYAKKSFMSGYHTYYFDAFSYPAAKIIYDSVAAAGIYKQTKYSGTSCHYFYLCRYTGCPVVLVEGGFLSNADEYKILASEAGQQKTAAALTDGIVKYFESLK